MVESQVYAKLLSFGEQFLPAITATLDPAANFLGSLDWIGESTHIIKLNAVDTALMPLSDALGMELTLIKFTASLFLVYPLAYMLFLLPGKNIKHAFSFLMGFAIMQWIYGPAWIHSFVSSFVTYLIVRFAPGKVQHKLAFWWVMGYMTASHLYRMYVSYMSGIFDFTGTQMVLTMKLTSFAFNVYDGTTDFKNTFGSHEDKKKAKVYGDRKKFAITRVPNLLEFFGYIYCFTCIGAGPAFEYMDYQKAITGAAFQRIAPVEDTKKTDGDKVVPKVSPTVKPNPLLPGLWCLLVGVVMLVGHLKMSEWYPMSSIAEPEFVAAHGHWDRYVYTFIALFGSRMKYYFVWKMAEGASVLGGFGFEGYDKTGKSLGWKAVENIDIWSFETASNVASLSRAWNKRTQGWLERYTYHRTGRSLLITYFVSAIWHGLYPGFFVFFLSLPLLTTIERLIKAKINPLVVPGYDGFNDLTYPNTLAAKLYWLVCVVCVKIVINFYVQPFSMQSVEHVIITLGGYNYVPHIAMFGVYILLELFPSPKKKLKD